MPGTVTPPPDLCGWVPMESGRMDSRWLKVKDKRIAMALQPPGRFTQAHDLVNSHVTYRREAVDRWDAPADTWITQMGDCEEFAILKRAILLASGIPDHDLFFLLVNDLVRREPHALLIARQGDKAYILDVPGGLTSMYQVCEAADFAPVAAYSGSGSWIYGRPA